MNINEMDDSLTILMNDTQQKEKKYIIYINLEETSRKILAGIFITISIILNINVLVLINNLLFIKLILYGLYIIFITLSYIITYKEDNIIYLKENIIASIFYIISLIFQILLIIFYDNNFTNYAVLIIITLYNILYISHYNYKNNYIN